MADIQRVVEILFNATDNTSAAIGSINSSLNTLEQSFSPFTDVQSTLIDVEKKILGVSVALAGLAIFEAGKFNESIAEIGTLFNASGKEVDKLKSQVLDFASTSSSSIGDATGALYNYISATGDTVNGVEALSKIERLAIAGKADLNTATSAVTTVLNAYGLKISDLSDVQDVFFTTVQNGTTTLPELGRNIGQIAAVAAAAGVNFDVVGSSMAALTGSIGNTNIATTQFKALLTELSKPSDELRAALGPLADEAGRLPEKLELIQKATGGTQVEMNKLFGSTEASSAALILANDSASVFNNTLLAMEDRAGATQRAYEEMEKQFGAVNTRLLNSVRTTLISAGDNLIDGYGEIAISLSNIFSALRPEIEQGAFDPIFNFLNQKAGEISGTFDGIAQALPEALANVDFTRLTESFRSLFDAVEDLFGALFGDVDLTSAEGLTDAVQGIIDAVALLNEIVAGIAEQWRPWFEVLGDLIQDNSEADKSFGQLYGTIIAGGSQISQAAGALGSLTGILEGLAIVGGAQVAIEGLVKLGATMKATAASGATLALAIGPQGFVLAGLAALSFLVEFEEVGKQLGSATYDGCQSLKAWAKSFFEAGEATEEVATETGKAKDEVKALAEESKELATASKEVVDAKMADQIKEINKAASAFGAAEWAAESRKEIKKYNAELVAARRELGRYEDINGDIIPLIQRSIGVWGEAKDALGENDALTKVFNQTLIDQIDQARLAGEITLQQADAYYEAAGSGKRYANQTKTIIDKTKDLTKQQLDLESASEKARLKLLEIASDERIAKFEATFEFKTAQVEAEAQKVEAAFETIGTAIESSGKALTDFYGILGSGNLSRLQELDLESTIRKEEERRQQAFDAEQALIEAQIENIRLRNEQLEEGNALIEVDGAGLQPHLEAFMFEILEAIQVRVNQEGYDTLIGA